mgnify:CR=1 FL=1
MLKQNDVVLVYYHTQEKERRGYIVKILEVPGLDQPFYCWVDLDGVISYQNPNSFHLDLLMLCRKTDASRLKIDEQYSKLKHTQVDLNSDGSE